MSSILTVEGSGAQSGQRNHHFFRPSLSSVQPGYLSYLYIVIHDLATLLSTMEATECHSMCTNQKPSAALKTASDGEMR